MSDTVTEDIALKVVAVHALGDVVALELVKSHNDLEVGRALAEITECYALHADVQVKLAEVGVTRTLGHAVSGNRSTLARIQVRAHGGRDVVRTSVHGNPFPLVVGARAELPPREVCSM